MKNSSLEYNIDRLISCLNTKKALEEVIAELRAEIQFELQANKSMMSEPNADGVYVQRVNRVTKVVDNFKAIEYLGSRPDIEKDLFLKIDEAKYKNLAERELKVTGEIIPGIDTISTEYISLKSKAKK